MKSRQDAWLLKVLDGCTFDDFGNREGRGVAESRKQILARLQTKFSTNLNLNIPLVSANMDTITRARMAIAHAKKGGIGIIDRFMTIEDQSEKVAEVKREENFVIEKPYHISIIASVGEARNLMRKNKVGGLVVLNEDGKLLGILTSRDIRFCGDNDPVGIRMTSNLNDRLITAKVGISMVDAKKLLDENRLEKLPLVDEDFRLRGLITSQDLENLEKYPLANKDNKGQLIVGAAIGVTGDYIERAQELLKVGVDVLVIDIAHGYSAQGERALRACRKRFPKAELVVGNVASGESVNRLQSLGANGIKVGIGPGSACLTRYHTNIAPPQGEAIYNCARVAQVPIIGDGGIRRDGHIFLCLLLGADSVMIGGRYAGTDETPGRIIEKSNKKKVKTFRGMASREAMVEKYRAELSEDPYEDSARTSPEGKEDEVEYKGSVVPIIDDMMGHLTSSISYMGATSLKEAKEMFMADPKRYLKKLSSAAQRESWDR